MRFSLATLVTVATILACTDALPHGQEQADSVPALLSASDNIIVEFISSLLAAFPLPTHNAGAAPAPIATGGQGVVPTNSPKIPGHGVAAPTPTRVPANHAPATTRPAALPTTASEINWSTFSFVFATSREITFGNGGTPFNDKREYK